MPIMDRLFALALGCALSAIVLGAWLWIRVPLGAASGAELPFTDTVGRWRTIELHVTDVRGRPIERFRGWMRFVDNPCMLDEIAHDETFPGGITNVVVPLEDFTIDMHATGFGRVKLGPFAHDAAPARLEIVLPDAVFDGYVTFEGQPVEGARITLLYVPRELAPGVAFGLFDGFENLHVATDAMGAFRIGSEYSDNACYVRATKTGYVNATVGPVRTGGPPLELRLHAGGSIEGRLRLPGARDPSGVEIELYRTVDLDGDADAYGNVVVRADTGGRFRFERVDPGPWLVRLALPELTDSLREGIPPEHVPFLVDAIDGVSVRLDMDVSQPIAELAGRMTIGGEPQSSTVVFLHSTGDSALPLDKARADMTGSWTVRARAPGRYRIVAWGGCERGIQPVPYSEIVDLPSHGTLGERDYTPGPCRDVRR